MLHCGGAPTVLKGKGPHHKSKHFEHMSPLLFACFNSSWFCRKCQITQKCKSMAFTLRPSDGHSSQVCFPHTWLLNLSSLQEEKAFMCNSASPLPKFLINSWIETPVRHFPNKYSPQNLILLQTELN